MLSRLNLTLETSDTEIDTLLHRVSRQSKIELDERQKEAVSEAVKHGVLILTGLSSDRSIRDNTFSHSPCNLTHQDGLTVITFDNDGSPFVLGRGFG